MDPIFLLLFSLACIIPSVLAGGKVLWNKFESGQMQIDPIKHPMLHRAQKIVRANNSSVRELEFQKSQTLMLDKVSEGISKIDVSVAEIAMDAYKMRQADQKHWVDEFNDLKRAEDERKAKAAEEERKRLAAEARRIADEQAREAQKVRQAELAEWTRLEVERQKISKTEIQSHKNAQREWTLIRNAKGETLRAAYREEDTDYSHRKVSVHAVNVRQVSKAKGKLLGRLDLNQLVKVTHWTIGQELYGNSVWFKIEGVPGATPSGWIWSGSVDRQTTSGISQITQNDQKAEEEMINATYTALERSLGIKETPLRYTQPMSQDELDFVREMSKQIKRL